MMKRNMQRSKDQPIQMQGEPAKRHGDKLEVGKPQKKRSQPNRRKREDGRK